MVRVYNCHPFSSQQIVGVAQEPAAVCCGRDTLFVLCAGAGRVQAFSVSRQGGCEPLCTFSTLGTVQGLAYSQTGDYLATIEERSGILYLRAYLNWRRCEAGRDCRVGVRMVGHILDGPFQGAPKDQMEIVEMPLADPPTCLSCCPVKGDLIVGCWNKVVLFHLKKQILDGHPPLLDFERVLILHFSLNPLSVSLCDGCVAVTTDLEVLVLMLEPSQPGEAGDQDRAQKMREVADPGEGKSAEESKIEDSPSVGPRDGSEEFVLFQSPLELLDEDTCASGVSTLLEWTSVQGLRTDLRNCLHVRQILYRRFAPDLSHIYSIEETALHSLQLLPMYTTGCPPGSEEKEILSLFCFFSMPHVGYLYSVGKMVQLLSTYQYPEKAKQAVLSSQFLHVITRNDLQCYTVRCSAVAARDEDPEMDTNNKACPAFFMQVCALRMQLFIGLQAACHSRNHLILLTRAEAEVSVEERGSKKLSLHKPKASKKRAPVTNQPGWNLYCLQIIPTIQLCREMVEYSKSYEACSPQSYVHLLSEAHLLLKAALLEPSPCDPDKREDVLSAFKESCLQMGDCYSRLDMDDFHLALPYYQMSGLPLSDIISTRFSWENKSQKFGKGFIYYLKHCICHEGQDLLSEEMANQVLHVFKVAEPTYIPHALCSPCMGNICLRTAWDHLERLSMVSPSPLVMLTKASFALRLQDLQQYNTQMERYTEMKLVLGFVDEPMLLLCGGIVATELARHLEKTQPGLLITAFVALLDSKKLQLEEADLFFREICKEEGEEPVEPQLLVDFWEAMLVAGNEEELVQRLLGKLVSVYVRRTAARLEPERKPLRTLEDLISSCSHFGTIFSWVNFINAPSDHPPSFPEDLQKLQSLLCGPSVDVKSVLPLLRQFPEDNGPGLSTSALCQTRLGLYDSAVDLLLDHCPQAVLAFARCHMQHQNQPLWWKKLLPELCRRTRGDGKHHSVLVASLKGFLFVSCRNTGHRSHRTTALGFSGIVAR
ncbi:Hermansky-Pudlak syndrome 3 protein isoform X2 [Callorhinchus milii]|uniref:Hermansky-Pudlak syndrome 3 protein isoform X2 n=1 Tax=Callorhinchus milii TaxID=7868 RepID=UPI001C3FF22E|nr:Hermansky-Pudlak syndrome 3 protein isoform X2 [Callorhinchus milii]